LFNDYPPGDVTFRFAARFPEAKILAVDGAAEMLRLAGKRKARERYGGNITFLQGLIPGVQIPSARYEAIISSSFLHHLHEPQGLWRTVIEHAGAGTIIFVIDLLRPESVAEARGFVELYCGDEPEILQVDFYNSLLSAFSMDEVRAQLEEAGLRSLRVEQVSDRHQIIYGVRRQ